MVTVDMNELIAAGYTFTIEDDRTCRDFTTSGELVGVSVEFPESYELYDDGNGSKMRESELKGFHEVEEEVEYLCDTTELLDSSDRWAHYADSHVRELELQRALYLHLDVTKRDSHEFYHLAKWRYRRWLALSRFAMRCSCPAKLRRMKKEVWKRYKQSVASCAKTGEWCNLYLTKDQVTTLCDLIEVELM